MIKKCTRVLPRIREALPEPSGSVSQDIQQQVNNEDEPKLPSVLDVQHRLPSRSLFLMFPANARPRIAQASLISLGTTGYRCGQSNQG